MKNIFSKEVTEEVIQRIESLTSETQPQWGKMSVSQMLAHCNVTYKMAYSKSKKRPKFLTKLVMKFVVKPMVVSEKPFKKNGKTAPQFLVSDDKDFEEEKMRLIDYIRKTQELGATHFEGKESISLGKLKSQEWNNMFYKHLDHHLTQFGV
ncbi:MAG: hypothetical protein CMB99_08480 [Flavobacteriaceae bacterium]|nr:hypothetical protein [Flavobacteriaceae bacterium]